MLAHRSFRSFARQFRTMRSKAGGVSGWNVAIAGGSDVRIAEITLA